MALSAGILPYRLIDGELFVMLVHPGGPYNAGKHKHTWSIPKGGVEEGESAFDAAHREFFEEVGYVLDNRFKYVSLGEERQSKHKRVAVWAVDTFIDVMQCKSNMITVEHPSKSGNFIEVPEVDDYMWFNVNEVKSYMVKGQHIFIEKLKEKVMESEQESRAQCNTV